MRVATDELRTYLDERIDTTLTPTSPTIREIDPILSSPLRNVRAVCG
jgi:hypothetical protein